MQMQPIQQHFLYTMTKAETVYPETYQKLDEVHLVQKSPKHPRKWGRISPRQYFLLFIFYECVPFVEKKIKKCWERNKIQNSKRTQQKKTN